MDDDIEQLAARAAQLVAATDRRHLDETTRRQADTAQLRALINAVRPVLPRLCYVVAVPTDTSVHRVFVNTEMVGVARQLHAVWVAGVRVHAEQSATRHETERGYYLSAQGDLYVVARGGSTVWVDLIDIADVVADAGMVSTIKDNLDRALTEYERQF